MELIKTEGLHYVVVALAILTNSVTSYGLVLIVSFWFYSNALKTF